MSGRFKTLTVCVLHKQLCGWAVGRHSLPHLGWLHAAGAAWYSPGFQIQMHHTRQCLHCWPGHSLHHLVESRGKYNTGYCKLMQLFMTQRHFRKHRNNTVCYLYMADINPWSRYSSVFTMLYEYIQSFSVAMFSCYPQRSHPMSVSSIHFGSMSKQQHQNRWATRLM